MYSDIEIDPYYNERTFQRPRNKLKILVHNRPEEIIWFDIDKIKKANFSKKFLNVKSLSSSDAKITKKQSYLKIYFFTCVNI